MNKRISFSLFFAASLFLWGCASFSGSASGGVMMSREERLRIKVLIGEGKRFFEQEEYTLSREIFRSIVKDYPEHKTAQKYLQQIEIRLGDWIAGLERALQNQQWKEARLFITKIESLEPDHPQLSAFKLALAEKERLDVELKKKNVKKYLEEARKLADENEIIEAIRLLRRVLFFEPGHQNATELLRTLEVKLKRKMEDDFESLLYTNVKEPINQGIEKYLSSEFQETINLLEVIQRSFPNLTLEDVVKKATRHLLDREEAEKLYRSAQKSIKKDRNSEALPELDQAMGLDSERLDIYQLWVETKGRVGQTNLSSEIQAANRLIQQGQWVAALEKLQSILLRYPFEKNVIDRVKDVVSDQMKLSREILDKERFKKEQADLYMTMEKFQEAIREYCKLIYHEPTNQKAVAQIRNIYIKIEQKEKMRKVHEGEEKARRKQQEEQIKKLLSDAEALFDKGAYDKAKELVMEVLDIDSGNEKALALMQKIRDRTTVRELTPEERKVVEALYQKGLVYYAEKRYEEAVIQWRKVLQLDPEHKKAMLNIEITQRKIDELKGTDTE